MLKNGSDKGRPHFRCRLKVQERNGRRVQISIAGENVLVGYLPTREAALRLRRKIREEAPRGQA